MMISESKYLTPVTYKCFLHLKKIQHNWHLILMPQVILVTCFSELTKNPNGKYILSLNYNTNFLAVCGLQCIVMHNFMVIGSLR